MAELNIEAERALFEAWYQTTACKGPSDYWTDPEGGIVKPLRWPKEYFAMREKVIDGGHIVLEYERDKTRDWFDVWQAARSAVPAQAGAADDYVLMPARLTAANGAKGALSGEFKECINVTCHECDGSGEDDEYGGACVECGGTGALEQNVPVTWDTIKDIYRRAVELLVQPVASHPPAQGVPAPGLSPEQISLLNSTCNTLSINGKAEAANLIRALAGITIDTPISAPGDVVARDVKDARQADGAPTSAPEPTSTPGCAAAGNAGDLAAKASDARYSEGYSAGWKEGRGKLADHVKECICNVIPGYTPENNTLRELLWLMQGKIKSSPAAEKAGGLSDDERAMGEFVVNNLLSDQVLTKAAEAVEASATVWAGFSMLDAKTCISAALDAAGIDRRAASGAVPAQASAAEVATKPCVREVRAAGWITLANCERCGKGPCTSAASHPPAQGVPAPGTRAEPSDADRLVWAMNNMVDEGMGAKFVAHVLQRGGTGDLSDCQTFVDGQVAAPGGDGVARDAATPTDTQRMDLLEDVYSRRDDQMPSIRVNGILYVAQTLREAIDGAITAAGTTARVSPPRP